jgi:signal transduction histidine kinase
MEPAAKPANEARRLEALRELNVLDTDAEQAFDDLTALAAYICNAPIAVVTLIDAERQWFKSTYGIDGSETTRDLAFCAHAILTPDLMEVSDALTDRRFFDHPMVTGDPNIRFYAGAPLVTDEGFGLGTLCVVDQKPRQLNAQQRAALTALSRQVVSQLKLRRMVTELQGINDSKHKVLTVLSHDLRSAFNVQINYADQLARKIGSWDNARIVDCANTLARAARDAHRMLSELLEWSRLELGAYRFEPQHMNIMELVTDVITSTTPQAEQKAINILIDADTSLRIYCDKIMMESALKNLLSNAIKFSDRNSAITLRAKRFVDGIRFSVVDNGKGMSAEQASTLFSSSGFVSSRGTQGETGTGVGTKLIREFIDRHSGTLEVHSEPGKGTTIHVTIPDATA